VRCASQEICRQFLEACGLCKGTTNTSMDLTPRLRSRPVPTSHALELAFDLAEQPHRQWLRAIMADGVGGNQRARESPSGRQLAESQLSHPAHELFHAGWRVFMS
jgi:hypothetical protein